MSTLHDTTLKLQDIRGNVTLLLHDHRLAWRVQRGTVAIFAVRASHGNPIGPRRYLFTCNQGDWLFGCSATDTPETFHFLVVGLEDSQLAEYTTSPEHQSAGYESADWRARVENWIERMGSILVEGERQVHAETVWDVPCYKLADGQSLKPPPSQVLWASVQTGTALLNGIQAQPLAAEPTKTPIMASLRLTAVGETTVTLNRTDELSAREIIAGLEQLHHACFRRLEQLERHDVTREAERLALGRQLQARDSRAAIDELSKVLLQRPLPPLEQNDLLSALHAIGNQTGIAFTPPPSVNVDAQAMHDLPAIARASRVRTRHVRLRGEWWRDDAGPLLVQMRDTGRYVALLRKKSHYVVHDALQGTERRVTSEVDQQLQRDATTFVRPLPDKTTSLWSLGRFATRPITLDLSFVVALSLTATILGMLLPISTRLIFDEAIPDANLVLLSQLAAAMLAMTVGQAALSFSQRNLLLRTDTLATTGLQAAVIDRLVRLPARFFRKYSSGDLQNRALMVTEISQSVGHAAVSGMLSGAMALLNLFLCLAYSPYLAVVALVSAVIVAGYTAGLSLLIRGTARRLGVSQGQLFGFQVQLISGVAKLRVAHAEQRAFNHWARQQAKQLRMMSTIQRIEQWGSVVNTALGQGSVIALYYFAATMLAAAAMSQGGVVQGASVLLTMGTFLAFYAAFMALIGGMTQLSRTTVDLMDSFAKRKMILPLLEQKPEDDGSKVAPGRLEGAISIHAVSFRYRDDGPRILSNVSLHANPGEFIAIVGPSGCGKSTLLRILLGFEAPRSGTIHFDGQDLAGLDGTAVRRQIGVVLQSGVLNAGTIYTNLSGASQVSLEDAWEAARAAGLAEDVEKMPMGMHTYLGEGGGTLSGGQRQRLLIARALVHRPRILIFDEATSALDNRTQQIVSKSIERLQATRIVVAHRLSTIRDANRIYVLEDGEIAQAGTFEELGSQDGLFRRMIARQLA